MIGQTCLHVRWGWLTFPIAFVLLTLIFFIAMIIDTRPTGDRAQIWKSSPLALIFHGLEPSNVHQYEQADVVNDMDRLAEGMVVKLAANDNNVVNLMQWKDEHLEEKG